jgi:hypothetical protein
MPKVVQLTTKNNFCYEPQKQNKQIPSPNGPKR